MLYFSPEDYLGRRNNRRVNSRQLINKKQQTKMNQSRGRFEATKITFHQPKEKELNLNYVSYPILVNRFSWTYKLSKIVMSNISLVYTRVLRFLKKSFAGPNQILRPVIIRMHISI